jgi:hypothetical protein
MYAVLIDHESNVTEIELPEIQPVILTPAPTRINYRIDRDPSSVTDTFRTLRWDLDINESDIRGYLVYYLR